MLTVMITLVPIFAIMLIGAWAEYRRILPTNTASTINQFVYFFSLPILLFSIMSQVDTDSTSWRPILGFLMGTGICHSLLIIIAKAKRKTKQESNVAGLMASFPNAAFMGIPVVMLAYPSNVDAAIYAGIAALLPTFSLVYADTSLSLLNSKKQNFKDTMGYVFKIISRSPQVLGAGLGLIISLCDLTLPKPIAIAAQMIGSTAAPCSLFCIGMTLAAQIMQWKQSINNDTKEKSSYALQAIIITTKLLFGPLLVFASCKILGANDISTATMTTIASMPTAIVCYVIAEKHNAFIQEGIMVIVISTILSCLTIPLIISLF